MDDQSSKPGARPVNHSIEVVFDQSGLNRSSRDQPDRTFPCPHPGCNVACKRKYERDRHYQTKHVQSKDLFCPVGRCRCSRNADELAEVLSTAKFSGWDAPAGIWASLREHMKAEVLEHQSDIGFGTGKYSKSLLHGFARRDRIIEHIKKAHKDIDTTADDFSIERDALGGEPILGELQRFWSHEFDFWMNAMLGRLQRTDGSWTEWFGEYRSKVAAAGFHTWSVIGEYHYYLLREKKGYEDVLPWEAHAILQKRNMPAVQESAEFITQSQLEHASTQTLNLYKEASLTSSIGELEEPSTQLWPTYATAPKSVTTPTSNFVVSYDGGGSASHSLELSADVPTFLVTPGHNGGSLSTDGGALTPIFHFGESLALQNLTTSIAAPAIPASGAGQEDSLWSGNFGFGNLGPALPALPWDDSDFGLDGMFNGEFNLDFSELNALPQWQPEGTVEHDAGDPEDQAGDYNGLGKRRFSQA